MAKATKELSTGNKGAKRAGKGETFIVTQEAFDVAFTAGRVVGGAMQAAAEAMLPLLAPLAGQTSETAVAQWNEYRRAFCLGMAAERGIDPDSARRMFGRIADFLGLDKPQTAKAAAAQAKRKAEADAARAAAGESDEASDEDGPSAKDGAGAGMGGEIRMGLTKIEAHIISLVRAGKFEMAAECIASLADAE